MVERKPVMPAATDDSSTPPRNGLEPVRPERMACQQCGGTRMEVMLEPRPQTRYRCADCGAWVQRPRR